MDKDLEQLRLLEVFHYPWTILAFTGLLGGFFNLLFGLSEAGRVMKEIIIGFGIYMIIVYGLSIPLSILAIICYRKRCGYVFCLGVAIFMCVATCPLGLPLGIFALVTLNRDSIKSLFRLRGDVGDPQT
jgi:hypothetical protein